MCPSTLLCYFFYFFYCVVFLSGLDYFFHKEKHVLQKYVFHNRYLLRNKLKPLLANMFDKATLGFVLVERKYIKSY